MVVTSKRQRPHHYGSLIIRQPRIAAGVPGALKLSTTTHIKKKYVFFFGYCHFSADATR